MFCIALRKNEHLILSDATDVKINDIHGYIKFLDGYGNVIALYKLSEIIGFHQVRR